MTQTSSRRSNRRKNNNKKDKASTTADAYDVCIVGAGPAGLAALSAIQDPYSLDILSPDQAHRAARHLPGSQCHGSKVLIVDPHDSWMTSWKHNFKALDIQFLRSPTMAHPDMFDQNALLAFAELQERAQSDLIDSGCGNLKSLTPLWESQVGLWKLPSLKLFQDFCHDLIHRLPHDYKQSSVTDIQMETFEEGGSAPLFEVMLNNGTKIKSTAVVLAMGTVGYPIIPKPLTNSNTNLPPSKLISWTDLDKLNNNDNDNDNCNSSCSSWKKALVIGGGLTAVQAAQRIVDACGPGGKTHVTLCSRRALTSKHFDLHLQWFDRRSATKCMSDFYHLSHADRLSLLKQERGGGSIPAIYLKALRKLQAEGRVTRLVGNIAKVQHLNNNDEDNGRVQVTIRLENDNEKHSSSSSEEEDENDKQHAEEEGDVDDDEDDGKITSSNDLHVADYDVIVLACGIQPDCESNPLIQKLLKRWPRPVVGGFPCLSEDLEWTERMFVVGGLGSLSIGPDAANLMGMRRAAQIVANSLECRCWLREEEVLKNPFTALTYASSSSSSDDDSDSDED